MPMVSSTISNQPQPTTMPQKIDLHLSQEALEKLTADAEAQGLTVEELVHAILAEEATRLAGNL